MIFSSVWIAGVVCFKDSCFDLPCLCLVLPNFSSRSWMYVPPRNKKTKHNKTKAERFPWKLSTRSKQTGMFYSGSKCCIYNNASFSSCMYQSEVKIQLESFGWTVLHVSWNSGLIHKYQTKDVIFNTGPCISTSCDTPELRIQSVCVNFWDRHVWLKNVIGLLQKIIVSSLPLPPLPLPPPPASSFSLNEQLPLYRNRYNYAVF